MFRHIFGAKLGGSSMWVTERHFALSRPPGLFNWLEYIEQSLQQRIGYDEKVLRFVITSSDRSQLICEATILHRAEACGFEPSTSSLHFVRRPYEDTSGFATVLVVPTGIGTEIGGHAGDAGPAVKLLGSISDWLITHPNAVNAADINESPENSLYVEGSVLSRFLLGTVGLQPARNNRVIVILDQHPDKYIFNGAVNSVNAARAVYGFSCSQIVALDPGIRLKVQYSKAGRAVGEVTNIESITGFLNSVRREFDAIAVSSVIDVPAGYHKRYFESGGAMVNPWGGVEAMLTHTLSTLFDVPSAHAPMMETREIVNSDPGIVDPRMSAEAISLTFLQCTLKGLQKSPRIISNFDFGRRGVFDATSVSCLVIPDGCIGIPTLAALYQSIPVIAVRENKNLMRNDLSELPWESGQLRYAENYLEAAGMIASMKAGVEPNSVRRPIYSAVIKPIKTQVEFALSRKAEPHGVE
jgi:hypothetical protein